MQCNLISKNGSRESRSLENTKGMYYCFWLTSNSKKTIIFVILVKEKKKRDWLIEIEEIYYELFI